MEKGPDKGRRNFLKLLAGGVLTSVTLKEGNTQDTKKRQYPTPAEGRTIRKEDANFSIFPEKLTFIPGKRILMVSAYWQTGAVYNDDGSIYLIDSDKDKPLMFQLGTGKVSTPTRPGLYEIQTKQNAQYRSHEFFVDDKKTIGADMPFAMHIGDVYEGPKGELKNRPQTGVAVHARVTVGPNMATGFMSHGCIGVEYEIAQLLQKLFNKGMTKNNKYEMGDFVLVFGEEIPKGKNLIEVIREVRRGAGDLLEKLKENSYGPKRKKEDIDKILQTKERPKFEPKYNWPPKD